MNRPATPSQSFKRTLGYAVILLVFIDSISQAISQEADVGQANFVTYCAECHGIDGRGKGPRSTTLSAKPADLTLLAKKSKGKFNPSAVFQTIDGRMPGARFHLSEEMPIWGCRHQTAPLLRRRLPKHQRYFPPAVTHDRDESATMEALADLPCDSETAIQNRILSIVGYLSRIQR